MSHKKVFEDAVKSALTMPDDNQAINFACTQLECMYQFTSSQSEVKAMCSHAVEKFYHDPRFSGNDHVLRIFQVLIRVSHNLGAQGIYDHIERDGLFKESLKFHILWGEAVAAKKNKTKFKDIWTLARERIPSKTNVDCAFRDIASSEFPEVLAWFDDEDPEKTLNILAPSTMKSRRRSSVAFLEKAALPAPTAPTSNMPIFMSKTNPLRTCIVDREKEYSGISPEEYRLAKTEDLADMEITMMQPIEEESEMGMEVEDEKEENCQSKKMRIYSPVRQPLIPKQDVKAPSPLIAHTSFTSNLYNKNRNAFSETMKEEEIVGSPLEKPSDATYQVERTPSTTVITSSTPSVSRESFTIFQDDGEERKEEEEEEEEGMAMPPPVTRPRGLSARPSIVPSPSTMEDDDPFDDNEPTVAGFNRGKKDRFLTSTPAVRGFGTENEEPNFWMEEGSGGKMELDSLNLSAIDKEDEEKATAPVPSKGSAFARKRKSLGGVVGDKARSSIGPKGGVVQPEMENGLLAKEMTGMRIGMTTDDKINPWGRDVRAAIMGHCSTPVNRHDLQGSIKQPKNGQKMELGGEMYSLEHLIGEGGFAKVFLCANEKKEMLAMKYETPSCEWEVYILEALRKRVRNETVMESLMQVTDAFIYQNCSLILSEYLPMGTLLQSANINTDPHWSIVVYLGMQMAKVLKDVHAANIVHADAKPDNWMVIEKINEDASIEELMDARNLRLIDWGRAIDMKALGGRPLYGRAGTDKFDCIEMCEGRPWTFHPDFYAFCATIYVLHMKEYMTVAPGTNGRYSPVKMFKRRLVTLALWTEIFDECFNIPDGSSLPSWSLIYDKLKGYLVENMDRSAWKEAVRKFNKSLIT